MGAGKYVPELVDALAGFNKIRGSMKDPSVAACGGFDPQKELSAFAANAVEDLCNRTASLAERSKPPVQVIVSCARDVRDALQRLQPLMPELLAEALSDFLGRVSTGAARVLFDSAATSMIANLVTLHRECSKGQSLDAAFEEAGRAEQAIASTASSAVDGFSPLLDLVSCDAAAAQTLVRCLRQQIESLFAALSAASCAAIGAEPPVDSSSFISPELDDVSSLEWNGPFALAVVWLGRRLEEKVVVRTQSQAKDLVSTALPDVDALHSRLCSSTLARRPLRRLEANVVESLVIQKKRGLRAE